VKQNALCVSWQLVKHSVVPVSVSDVASLEVSLLLIESGTGPRFVNDLDAIFDSGETELFEDLNRIRLGRLVNAVTPCKIL
jgi:hypothetical protein